MRGGEQVGEKQRVVFEKTRSRSADGGRGAVKRREGCDLLAEALCVSPGEQTRKEHYLEPKKLSRGNRNLNAPGKRREGRNGREKRGTVGCGRGGYSALTGRLQ